MALIVEDGTIVAGAESFVSVSDCDAYHVKMNNTGWTGTEAVKEAALRKATNYLEGRYILRWKGHPTDEDQVLSWPRQCIIVDGREVADDSIPARVKNATCELALLVVAGVDLTPLLERGGQVRSKTEEVGPITERTSWFGGASVRDVVTVVDDYLRPYIARTSTRELVRS